jgi:hypothetical protein
MAYSPVEQHAFLSAAWAEWLWAGLGSHRLVAGASFMLGWIFRIQDPISQSSRGRASGANGQACRIEYRVTKQRDIHRRSNQDGRQGGLNV